MTEEESSAVRLLNAAKQNAKDALQALDPNPIDPITAHILNVITASDSAVKAIIIRSDLARKPMGGAGSPSIKQKCA